MRKFQSFGPFEVPRDGKLIADKDAIGRFWKSIDAKHPGLSGAKGCYVFGVRPTGTKRILPWYVGQTNNQDFTHECFKDHKTTHYNKAMHKKKKGTPYLYLVASMKPKGGFSMQNLPKTIEKLEEHLISPSYSARR